MSLHPHDRDWSPRRVSRARAVRRRRLAVATLLTLGLTGGAALALTGSASPRKPPSVVGVRVEGRVVARVRVRDAENRSLPAAVVARSLPSTVTVRRRGATLVRALDRRAVAARAGTTRAAVVTVRSRGLQSTIPAPVVAQRLRNNCETAALQVLLATSGVRVDQLRLQDRLTRNGPPDPGGTSDAPVWGDPDRGYVGRADGSGPWGGFGVYPEPVRRLAARYGRRLRNLSGAMPETVYRRVLDGRAVIAWVGLADGPYRSWTSPSGRPVTVNLNEHTVVLTGVRRDGTLDVVNVLQGTREVWTRSRFERDWRLLGRRALASA